MGRENATVDFFDVKADVEALLALTGAAAEFRFVPESIQPCIPGAVRAIFERQDARRLDRRAASGAAARTRFDICHRVLFELELTRASLQAVPVFRGDFAVSRPSAAILRSSSTKR